MKNKMPPDTSPDMSPSKSSETLADTPSAPSTGSRVGAQLLDRAVLLMDLIASGEREGVALKALCDQSGLNKATCHRILGSLVEHGMLQRDASGRRYRLGTKLMVLGAKAASGPGLRSQCQPALARLRGATGATAMLMARDGDDSVCIDRHDGDELMQTLTGSIGGHVPLGVGPGSLAMLSFLSDAERDAVLTRNWLRIGEYPVLTQERVLGLIEQTRQQGYALDRGEIVPGVAGISLPIYAGEIEPVASMGFTFLSARVSPALVERYVSLLREEVGRLEPYVPSIRHSFGSLQQTPEA